MFSRSNSCARRGTLWLINKLPAIKFDHEMNSEHLAGVAAIEMLLPWKYRPEMQKMMGAGKSDYEIAHAFRALEKVVSLLLRTPYGKVSADSNSAHRSDSVLALKNKPAPESGG